MNAGEAPDDVADAPVAMMLKRGRGRPRKDDAPIVRPAKAGKACTGAVLQVYADDRNRAGKEWVEVAPRPVGRELSAEDRSYKVCEKLLHTREFVAGAERPNGCSRRSRK